MKAHKIVIGSRGSQLALWQANWVKSALERLYSNVDINIRVITTSGDKIQDVPLAKIGGKGLFVKEIEEALLAKEIDLAVHSMKDVPIELPAELVVSVITKRESPLDALISKNGETLANLPQGSSQLLKYRVDFDIHPLRGNVDTRLRKVKEGYYDAIILASAGLNRLGWASHITEEISDEVLLPAMGQGALGIETRLDDAKTYDLISALNHEQTNYAVTAERSLVGRLDGGCQVPIGAYAKIDDNLITLKGLVASLDGEIIYRSENVGPVDDAIIIGQELGSKLLKMGANEILEKLI